MPLFSCDDLMRITSLATCRQRFFISLLYVLTYYFIINEHHFAHSIKKSEKLVGIERKKLRAAEPDENEE